MVRTYTLSSDQVSALCPSCAGKMHSAHVEHKEYNVGDYTTVKSGDGWVVKDKAGKAIGNAYTSKEKADEACESLRESRDHVLEFTNSINGVEIFSSGTHNGDEYPDADLDEIVDAFKKLDYRPAVKIGHSKDTPGGPAYGWVQNVRRVGNKLVADLTDMHDSVVSAIRSKAYDRVSSEIYFNLKRGGQTFRRALKAVALLGCEVPAVANLVPLHKIDFSAECEHVGMSEQELSVLPQTLVDSLATRVSGLVNLIKEYDMSKKSEQINALKAQVEKFNQDMEELKKKKGKLTDEELEKDGEYKQLSDTATELNSQLAELEGQRDDEDLETIEQISALTAQLAQAKEREKIQSAETKALAEKVSRIERDKTNQLVGEKVKACKIPAFRNALTALYSYSLEHGETTVKLYSQDKDGKDVTEEKTLAEVVDGVVTQINDQSEKLFKSLAFSGSGPRKNGTEEDDPGREVQNRVAKYRQDHPEVKTYEAAMSAVLGEDQELSLRYRSQLGNEQ